MREDMCSDPDENEGHERVKMRVKISFESIETLRNRPGK